MSTCQARDARCTALRLLAESGEAGPAFVYGTSVRCLVALGATDEVSAGTWSDVDGFLDGHEGQWRVGWLGFGLHRGHPGSAWLAVPRLVLEVGAGDAAAMPCTCGSVRHRAAVADDDAGDPAWDALAEQAAAFVGDDRQRRLTIARRVALREPVDVAWSFRAGGPMVPEARGWYARAGGFEHAGVSPEVLAEGDVTRFRTTKLSGTGPRSDDPEADAPLRKAFERDPKIGHEHDLSRSGTQRALQALGFVEVGPPRTLDLSTLRHRASDFTTSPRPGTKIGACLRAVHPLGAWPAAEGLDLLERFEAPARGAYYGLGGVVRPDGGFSFTQVLRAVFRDAAGPHTWAGAAFTALSTPADEWAETRNKLSSIRVAG